MEVTLAVLADCANLTQDGKLNIMGMFGEVNPTELPFTLPTMYLIIVFSASPSEVGLQKEISIHLMNEDGKNMLTLKNDLVVPAPPRSGSKVLLQTMIGLNGVAFDRPGDYQFAIHVNGEHKLGVPLRLNDPLGTI